MLHTPALPVTDFDSQLGSLIADMFETMRAAPGVGLAAPQVGIPLQVFVYEWADGDTTHRGVAINPTLTLAPYPEREPDEENDSEGCLSFPGYRFPLVRSESVLLRAQDEHGASYELPAEGWLARIFQHEFDHLQGSLYVDRLLPIFEAEVAAIKVEEDWGVPGKSWLPGTDRLEG